MTAKIPTIKVYLEKGQLISRPGMAGKVALIGAFDSVETNPVLCTSLTEAQDTFGTDATYNGCSVLEPLYDGGVSSTLIMNFTTKSGQTADKTLTTQKLTDCLAKIKGEDWDILFIAETLTDAFVPIIQEYLDECFEIKYPAGFIGVINGSTDADNVTTAGLVGEHCYGLLTQSFSVDGTALTLLQSGAYYCGVIAGLNVGNTMTMKSIPHITAITPELSFENGGSGKILLEAGITTVKCQDRGNANYIVVNSEQPNGLDLYVNRTRDFIVKEFALHQFLGERNREATLNEIKQEIERVKDICVNTLDLLEDINYRIVKKDANCVDIYIDSLLFAGIITEIDMYVRIEVQ